MACSGLFPTIDDKPLLEIGLSRDSLNHLFSQVQCHIPAQIPVLELQAKLTNQIAKLEIFCILYVCAVWWDSVPSKHTCSFFLGFPPTYTPTDFPAIHVGMWVLTVMPQMQVERFIVGLGVFPRFGFNIFTIDKNLI